MASQKQPGDLVLESLRGGFNDEDPPNALAIDECTVAENVEFFYSTLGERRLGMQGLDLSGSGLSAQGKIVFLGRHFTTENELDNQLWAVAASEGTGTSVAYRDEDGWHTVTPSDAIDPDAPDIYNITGQSLDNKFYLAYPPSNSTIDRLHVWDGTSLRKTGLKQPAAPTVADEGAGTFANTRYYRVRYIKKSGSDILLRSEPSDTYTFEPSGTGAGARITRPALISEDETHWEVEASVDDANYYIIATLTTATTTYDDELIYDPTDDETDTYADVGDLSEDIGAYTTLPAARFLAADDDRLILGGSFVDPDLASRVQWTPVRSSTGVGSSERIDASVDSFIDLDNYEGGGLTGISQALSGSWYAFKWSHIYKLVRTGNRQDAYTAITLSKARGALPGSIVSGMDEYGRPCVYFLDPHIGPSRISVQGLQQIKGLRNTWKRVNTSAETVVSRGVYYPDKQQVWWWVAVDGSDVPNLRLVLQVNELRETQGGVKRGWSLATGRSAEALAACVLTEQLINEDDEAVLSTRPIMGFTALDFIQRGDVMHTDNGEEYIAKIRTRPLFTAGLLNRWGAMTAALLAAADENARIAVRFIRNYGLETNQIITNLAPEADEDYVIKAFDNLIMSSSTGVQIEFSDLEPIETVNDGLRETFEVADLQEGVLYHSEPEIDDES